MLNQLIMERLADYHCHTQQDYKNALLEIIQEIALFGLWRSKFFEHAAFYGGTALRIVYGLDRFSEDLDFSLLSADRNFSLKPYHNAVQRELESYGFKVSIEQKDKKQTSQVESAFIKGNTAEHLLMIGIDNPAKFAFKELKVKFEVDTDPPPEFLFEPRPVIFPAPFSVRTYSLPSMFAGKMHALLFRDYQRWVKGRDWYDYLWFIARSVPIHLAHLEQRMVQSKHWSKENRLTQEEVLQRLRERINELDIPATKTDVQRFIADPRKIDFWSKDYFLDTCTMLQFE